MIVRWAYLDDGYTAVGLEGADGEGFHLVLQKAT
jgi:hypothetical protein